MADLPPEELPPPVELLPPAQAWGMRFAFFGVVLVMLSFACGSVRNPAKFFADKMLATGEITVMGHDSAKVEAAFERARAAVPAEAGLTLLENGRQSVKYQAWLTAPDRQTALAQIEAVLAGFQKEHGGEFGRDLWTFGSSWVEPAPTPKVRLWSRRISTAVTGMFLLGAASVAGGVWKLWVSVKGDKRQLAELLFQTEDPGIKPPAEDEDDEDGDEPPKPGPPPPTTGGEPETKVL